VKDPGRELRTLLGDAVPGDHARQTLADAYIAHAAGRRPGRTWRVLDLGCGTGTSVDYFRARDPEVEWIGIDLEDSREVRERRRSDARFESFNGVEMPFEDGRFDLVYCKQVLEHVRRPAPLLAEVSRVLAPGGAFAGSTSQLEPFHSMSVWNYTPIGFEDLLREAGLHLVEIRPGIDAVTILARRLLGSPRGLGRAWARWWGGPSPLNRLLDGYGTAYGLDARSLNAIKLVYCAKFAFLAERAGA
jgi:SAM-dependent methyltransferase